MATEYNITQKQYNGTDYDTLYPKTTSQQVLLNDNTISYTGDATVNGALTKQQTDIGTLNSKFAVAGDVASVQFGVTDTNLQIRFDCGAARGVYFFNIHRGSAQVSLMRTYNGQTTTIWTLT